ncbi:MAG: rhodanese-like domain-containing protein [Gammaproteobacteria bacterium]|nr:MAG: rhodanese-like domain-containing protein [Gammaproteobacteria bacterium]
MGNAVKSKVLHQVILVGIALLPVLGLQSQALADAVASKALPKHTPVINQQIERDETDGDCYLEQESENQQTISYAGLITSAGKSNRDLSKYISIKKFASQSKQLIKIDIRPSEQFEKFHITGSINLNPFELKGKNYLKAKQLVIIDSGYRFDQVESLAEDLKSKGFKSVKILDGGLTAWTRYGGRVDGDIIEARKVNRISAQEYEIQQKYRGWLPLVLRNTKPEQRVLIQIPNAIEIDTNKKTEKQVIKQIDQILSAELEQNKEPELLLIADQNLPSWYSSRLANKIPYPNLYVLEGGLQGYIEQAQKRQLAAKYDGRKKGAVKCSQK